MKCRQMDQNRQIQIQYFGSRINQRYNLATGTVWSAGLADVLLETAVLAPDFDEKPGESGSSQKTSASAPLTSTPLSESVPALEVHSSV